MHEKISAFLDGELDPEEARVLQARIATDPEARKIWAEYQLVRQVIRTKTTPAHPAAEVPALIWSAAALVLVGAIGMTVFLERTKDEEAAPDPIMLTTLDEVTSAAPAPASHP